MGTVSEDIGYLIQIVRKDNEMRERRVVLEIAPPRIAAIDREIGGLEKRLKEAEQAMEKWKREKLRLDDEVKLDGMEIDKKKKELNVCKTNEEYRAKIHEIDFLKKKIDKAEERILEILDSMEETRREVAEVQSKINEEKDVMLAERQKLTDAISRAQAELDALESEKLDVLPSLSARTRKLYERILAARGDSAVANLVGDICQGCHSRVPPQKSHEVRRNDALITCEACSRILVYYENDT
ncbi:MAG: C4-type zinc ribbon domain-containing protein [Candidatus Krumholzibacteria bacterium]|nr:C4-type zinc ribbon domain-containing protein [Candidatus Krumholzibacteria bacterium]